MIQGLKRLDDALVRAESWALVLVIGAMVLLAFGEVMSKLLANYPVEWIELAVRYLVLWVAFIGGSVATHAGRHITIDITARYLHGKAKAWTVAITSLVAVFISLVLFWVSLQYLAIKFHNQDIAFTIRSMGMNLPVKSYVALVVIPPALLAMGWHFLVTTLTAIFDPTALDEGEAES
jgi:TRAP-type C4-dicarboxylate transport system permease small subunit